MSVIQRPRRHPRRLPRTFALGLVLMLGGFLLDARAALQPPTGHAAHAALHGAHAGHVIALAGMAIVLAGVVIHGARRHLRRRAVTHGGLDPDAHR